MILGEKAIKCGRPIKGVKGISPLADCLDLVECNPVDYMHAVLKGIMGRLMYLWFDTKNHRQSYYLGKSVRAIDRRLISQIPPNDFTRSPRPIASHRKYWKATELNEFYSTIHCQYYKVNDPAFIGNTIHS